MKVHFFDTDSEKPVLAITFDDPDEIIMLYHRTNISSFTVMQAYKGQEKQPINVELNTSMLWMCIANFCSLKEINPYTKEKTPEAEGEW